MIKEELARPLVCGLFVCVEIFRRCRSYTTNKPVSKKYAILIKNKDTSTKLVAPLPTTIPFIPRERGGSTKKEAPIPRMSSHLARCNPYIKTKEKLIKKNRTDTKPSTPLTKKNPIPHHHPSDIIKRNEVIFNERACGIHQAH